MNHDTGLPSLFQRTTVALTQLHHLLQLATDILADLTSIARFRPYQHLHLAHLRHNLCFHLFPAAPISDAQTNTLTEAILRIAQSVAEATAAHRTAS